MQGLDESIAALDKLGSMAPAALADAINHTAHQSRIALRAETESVFDNPTNFTKNAFAVQQARPGQEVAGSVFVKDTKQGKHAAVDWFEPQVFGGGRPLKDSEQKLRKMGILPAGMYTVPGRGAKLNSNGNISSQHVIQLLWSFRRQLTYGASRRHKDVGAERFFVIKRGKIPIGIAERVGSSIKVVLVFARKPVYARRFEFEQVVERIANENLEQNIDTAVVKALG